MHNGTNADQVSSARRPVQNFLEMGFSVGDRVAFRDFPDENIVLADGRSFLWDGRQVSLTHIRQKLGERSGTGFHYGPMTIAGRPAGDAYDATYGALEARPKAARARSSAGKLTFKDIVASPSELMGVKAVWGTSIAPVMCFGSRSVTNPHQLAADVAKKVDHAPLLLTIGGGKQVPRELAGRALEVVRVSRAYGETKTLVEDPDHYRRLEQWPSSIVLMEVYTLLDAPDLVRDLGLPDRRALSLAFDTVKTNVDDIEVLWSALKDWPVERNEELALPHGFKNPSKPTLVGQIRPTYGKAEGLKRYREARVSERDATLRPLLLELNRQANDGHYVCEGCDFTHDVSGMFDAHHLHPLFHGERVTRVDDLALLCPTCHRAAHRLTADPAIPLSIEELRQERFGKVPSLVKGEEGDGGICETS